GIGFACAAELVSAGARVVICARGEGALEEAGAKLRILPGAVVRAVRADVACSADVERVLDVACALGGLDGLVHCAAVLGPIGPVVGVDPEAWWERSEEHTSELQSLAYLVCRLLLEKKKKKYKKTHEI